jgi:hypothetical protein
MNHLVDVPCHVSQLELEPDASAVRREFLEERFSRVATGHAMQRLALDGGRLGLRTGSESNGSLKSQTQEPKEPETCEPLRKIRHRLFLVELLQFF